ncbi:putative protein kinase RLK-Pelle-SD-2b family [Rosa chinensis]|uniref:Receptor-like serine/threonine-protein kinase n=1 Tax=Rosa chinensis TaxID=74649 RepID=A0A2P6PEP6_ROSCH|nr:G-type lectin S-receptor-like serine/threonine-protein kinase At5g35370 [Rosa chinensis]PRQ20383.1 putative protein kinase RLK-Pelle-SD-2b family [Rosa chinensis]
MDFLYALCLSFATFSLCFLLFPILTASSPILNHSITPNFTATNMQFIDNSGAFLESPNGTFRASINTLESIHSHFYFSVIHVASNTIIWSANRNTPISYSAMLSLTIHGLSIADDSNRAVWSTPSFNSNIASLQLLDTGNLILVDAQNVSLWNSFDSPTDTLIIGQRLYVGTSLNGAVGNNNLSVDDYRLAVTSKDLVLQWKGQTYWKLSMEAKAFKNSDTPVSYMEMNRTGLYLFGADGSEVVFQVFLETSDTKIGRLGYEGVFSISGFMGNKWVQDFVKPVDICQRPFTCGKLGFCSNQNPTCICPTGFHYDAEENDACVPIEDTISLPSSCDESGNSGEFNSSTVYLELQKGMDYFGNHFNRPVNHVMNLSLCQDVCSQNCSCQGIFHENSSGSCYLLEYNLGSLMPMTFGEEGLLGYIKAISTVSVIPDENKKHGLAVSSLVVIITFSGFVLATMLVMIIIWLRKKRYDRMTFGRLNSFSTADLEVVSIPGLPVRFSYEELVAATENFNNQIGSGGFGTVYKGIIADKTVVAVKKISSLGVRGKVEFCNETASIGNIHHVNLVKLRGFCIHGKQCFLVYDYMNRGSLEKILFGNESNDPVLEWQKRYEIALGMARGLAYLHSGCQQKIIHCDIKPENILLHSDFQVKISDFGLAKLLSHENSKLLTTLSGTRGYLAPEWLTSHGITDKTDVYSYGMVLLELVRGRRNCLFQCSSTESDVSEGNGPSFISTSWDLGMVYFPLLALEMHKQRRYKELADPRLEGRVRIEEVETLVRVALSCLHIVPTLRPSMTNVVAMLEGRLHIGEPRVEALEFLRLYGGKTTETSRLLTRIG